MPDGKSEGIEGAPLAELKARLVELNDLGAAASVLSWDQAVYMPPAGAVARGRQIARLAALAHQKATDPALGRLLDKLAASTESLPPDSQVAALIRVAQRDFDLATRVPAEYVARSSEHGSASYNAWVEPVRLTILLRSYPILKQHLNCRRNFLVSFLGTNISWTP